MAAQPASVSSIDVGDIRVTYLLDGEAHLTATGVFPASSEAAWQAHRQWLDENGWWVTTFGGFLIETGDRRIVVDLGFGDQTFEAPDFAKAWGGQLLDSLKQTGTTPEQVDTVVFTHMHSDHTGWTSPKEGGPQALTFPNAKHFIGSDSEWTFWQENPDVPFNPGESVQALANRIETASDGQALAPGVNVRATPGHTPGHQSLVLSSGAARAILLGDVIHCPAQLAEPEWSVIFDVDQALARRTRDQLLAELDGSDVLVGCSHFAGAAFGRVLPADGKRMWQVSA